MALYKLSLFLPPLLLGLSLAKPMTPLHRRVDELTLEEFAGRIAEGPEECKDFLNPSEECLKAIKRSISIAENNKDNYVALSGGRLIWEPNSGCQSKEAVVTAAYDAHRLASLTVKYANDERHTPIWNTWMGPNYGEYKNRIVGNLGRISNFRPHDKYDIYMSCNDPQKQCNVVVEGRPLKVGGYAWTKKGWFGSYSYINLCETFFTLSSLRSKIREVDYNKEYKDGSYARQAAWQLNMAEAFLHEMMHLNITSVGQPYSKSLLNISSLLLILNLSNL